MKRTIGVYLGEAGRRVDFRSGKYFGEFAHECLDPHP
jgi:hypothetical protein